MPPERLDHHPGQPEILLCAEVVGPNSHAQSGITEKEVIDDAEHSSMDALAEATEDTDKVLVFRFILQCRKAT